jgi:hypothetical protein
MSVRARTSLLSILLIVTLGSFAAVARVSAQPATDVQIDYITFGGTTLTVIGKNLGGGSTQVQVDSSNAAVSRSSDTEIVAETAPLAPGRYKVTVLRDSNPGGSSVTTLLVR